MRYKILKPGISQRPAPGEPPVPKAVGTIIEVSDKASVRLLKRGLIERAVSVQAATPEDAPRPRAKRRAFTVVKKEGSDG